MNELRSLVQSKLEEIQEIETSAEVPDEVIEDDKTYFSYKLTRTVINSDTDRRAVYRLTLNGIIKRKTNPNENTLEIMDNAQDLIESKLKELNIMADFQDVSVLDTIKKTSVTARTTYYEANKGLI